MGAIVVVVVSVIGFVSAPAGAFSSRESVPVDDEQLASISRFDDPPESSRAYTPDSASNARPKFLRSLEDLGISRAEEEAEITSTGHYKI
jgi:hypothetical protein